MTETITLSVTTEALAPEAHEPSKATTPAGFPLYGCEHVEKFLSDESKAAAQPIQKYIRILKALHEHRPRRAQTCSPRAQKGGRSLSYTSIRPTYHCLQCSNICGAEARDDHGTAEGHDFAVESRSGSLYCLKCRDHVYDRLLEELRNQRDAETAYPGRKKRKLHELYPPPDDVKYILANSSRAPCKAAGLRGLYNMGQTCFISVILQSLIHNPLLRNYFLADGHKAADCSRENCLSCAVDEIFSDFFTVEKTDGYGAVNVLNRSWLRNPAWAGCRQQDAHEYFQYLVDQLHSESTMEADNGRDRCACIIHQTYYGRLQSDVTCMNCNFTSTTYDPMIDLSLDLRNTQVEKQEKHEKQEKKAKTSTDKNKPEHQRLTLYDCLRSYIRSEETSYNCERCQGSRQSAMKRLSIRTLPPVLAIQFKRFEAGFDAPSAIAAKLNTQVRFPLQLDMSPYTTRARRPDRNGSTLELLRSCTYDLSTVVVHIGQINGGHYVVYCREGHQWYLFDDNKVSAATEAQVLGAEAYLLMYTVRNIT